MVGPTRSWTLGTADAASDELATATWTVTPIEVEAGSATLVPESGESVKVRIR